MPNIQQPEMRRSGRDPLVQDSAKQHAGTAPGDGPDAGPVPPDQRSPYGPQAPAERRADADDAPEPDAVLVDGPRAGITVHSEDAALLTLEIQGLIHRYVRSTAQREVGGRELLVYNYDGEVRPG